MGRRKKTSEIKVGDVVKYTTKRAVYDGIVVSVTPTTATCVINDKRLVINLVHLSK